MILVHFQGKSFNITVIQVYLPTIHAKEAEAEWFYEDLQDLLELTSPCQKKVLFIIRDWNAKEELKRYLESQVNLALEYKMKQGKANRVLSKEFAGHRKHPLPTTQEKTLHMDINRWSY